MKTKKRIFAIHMEVPAIPVKPNIPAMIATTRKTTAQYSMITSSCGASPRADEKREHWLPD
jgi:hypothetical protein